MSNDLVKQDLTLNGFIHYVIKNDIDLGISFSLNDGTLKVKIINPIILELADSLELTIHGETNITSKGLNLDTLFDQYKTVLHLNSREAKQIRNLPESIKYRENMETKTTKLEELTEHINGIILTPDASLDEKIEFLQSFKPKMIG